jgi:DNA polymerase (family 10)
VARTGARIIAQVAPPLPSNAEIAAQLELLADILELEGEDPFRVLAYRRAAARIRESGASVAQLALEGKARQLQGIGPILEGKILEAVREGEVRSLTKHKALVPPGVVEIMRLPGLGPKTARRLWQELGITTLQGLKEAAEAKRLRRLSGFGPKTEERILAALAARERAKAAPARTLLGVALPAVLQAVEELRRHPAAVKVCEAGSVRRRKETVRDLDLVATARDAAALIDHFCSLPWVRQVLARGGTKAAVVSREGLRFDLRVVPPDCYGNLLQHLTGSKQHNMALREEAARRGLSVSEYGVRVGETGRVVRHADEEDLYRFLGYQYIPPELRENAGELEAAREGALPALVEVGEIAGDLHCHSSWSLDGHDSLETMALAARARGYAYLAVTDHAHHLRDGRLEAQEAEIDALNRRLAPFRLLKGVEVDIRADGSLDLPDETLAGREWVVASVHTSFGRDPNGRIIAAMENPHVDCIAHPSGRKIGRREGYALDMERVVEAALRTGTALEINSQPDRLDLPDTLARLAGEAGVSLVVSSDAHRSSALATIELGVAQARRAWLGREQVLNTRPWPEIERGRRP